MEAVFEYVKYLKNQKKKNDNTYRLLWNNYKSKTGLETKSLAFHLQYFDEPPDSKILKGRDGMFKDHPEYLQKLLDAKMNITIMSKNKAWQKRNSNQIQEQTRRSEMNYFYFENTFKRKASDLYDDESRKKYGYSLPSISTILPGMKTVTYHVTSTIRNGDVNKYVVSFYLVWNLFPPRRCVIGC